MKYNELKKEYDNARKEQLAVDREIRRIDKEVQQVDALDTDIQQRFSKDIIVEKNSALKAFIEKQTRPYEDDLLKAEERLQQVQAEYDEKRSENTFDNLLAQCSSKQDILNEVRDTSVLLRERLEGVLGKENYSAVSDSLECTSLDVNAINFNQLISRFNESSQLLEKYSEGSNVIEIAVDKLEGYLSAEDVQDDSSEHDTTDDSKKDTQKVTILVAFLIVIVTVFFREIIFTVYALVITMIIIFNIIRNYRVYKIAIIHKAVCDNVDAIDAHLKSQIEDTVKQRAESLDSHYVPLIEKLNSKIANLKQAISDIIASADNTFVFDDSKIQERMSLELEQNNRRKSALLVAKNEQESLLKQKTERVNSLSKDLNSLLQGLQEKFLFGVGKDVIFNPNFLFDIDTAKGKPEYFVHPETSCLFLYDEMSTVTDFIRLLSVQLRSKLNPFNLSITVVDTRNMGRDFVYFTESGSNANTGALYSIVVNEDGEKAMASQVIDDLMKRQSNISREFGNIKEYNERMVAINSLAESYEFIFIIEPNETLLKMPDMSRIITNGADLGIYTHIFMQIDDFKTSKLAEMLLKELDKFYVLESSQYFERARDFIAENMLQLDSE